MTDPIAVVSYDPKWKEEFNEIGTKIRQTIGQKAIRIDHIGSTSIIGLAAKPVIDIQVSVKSLEPMTYKPGLESIGFYYRENNPDLTKRYFREGKGFRRTHIHVRLSGSWSEQFALLFRDYLRVHPEDGRDYVQVKYELMEKYKENREMYVKMKGPIIWKIMRKASEWSQESGWKPPKSDV